VTIDTTQKFIFNTKFKPNTIIVNPDFFVETIVKIASCLSIMTITFNRKEYPLTQYLKNISSSKVIHIKSSSADKPIKFNIKNHPLP